MDNTILCIRNKFEERLLTLKSCMQQINYTLINIVRDKRQMRFIFSTCSKKLLLATHHNRPVLDRTF